MTGYTKARAFSAEGARVGIVTCERCGAALLIDIANEFEVTVRHTEWHDINDHPFSGLLAGGNP